MVLHRSAGVVLVACAPALAQLSVSTVSPGLNANNVARNAAVSVTFDRALDPATLTPANFSLFGKLSGPISGPLTLSNANRTVTLTPARSFAAGEVAVLTLSHNLRAADGTFLRSAGYEAMFTTASEAGHKVFRKRAEFSNRTNNGTGPQTRIYGGLACDLNRDGWCDLTTINEVSSDLRVFLNRADGSGLMQPMLQPFTPIPLESSPNEVGDFNRDGFLDVVVSSSQTHEIAVAMGHGDGTFQAPTVITVGFYARGFGIVDYDGDGDQDITVACLNSDAVYKLTNNAGTFAPPVAMSVAGGPYGMTAADMDRDGILDLVVGCRDDQACKILRGNGNGTFTQVSSQGLGGANWVVMCGDLNGDGHMDVSTANSFSANGSILMGNGNATLQPATVYAVGGHSVSTDLADLDGDGDLDWVLSSFGAGLWYVYLNNGSGVFSPLQQVVAPANPSCAVPMDFDNDFDIDLVLTDEIADVCVFLANVCPADYDDGSGTGTPDNGVTIDDLLYYLGLFEAGDADADLDDGSSTGTPDGGVTIDDLIYYLTRFEGGC
jgi:hypothetical protein